MNRIAKLLVLVLALGVSGCITVFPKTKPAQLYRFDGPHNATSGSIGTGPKVGVLRAAGTFTAAAAGDRILTVTGSEVAYLAQSRWAQQADTLFNEALVSTFNAGPGPARLVARGEPAKADYTLRLDVQRFEAAYDHGPRAAPEVRIEVHLVLIRNSDRALVRDETLSFAQRARGNRVSSIVTAFNQAVGETLTKVVADTNASLQTP